MEQIGRGGFGTVYRAYQTAFRRQVAVKVLSVGTSDDTTIRRFRREVGAVGSLSGHPHIVVVHDIGTTEQGDPYLVMAHLAGGTLTDRIEQRGALPWRSVVAWTIKLAGALEAAHSAGVLHLDVKPDNVLFDEFGEPQLVDFGIARLEGVTHSRSNHVKATPLYAAPEVLSGSRPSAEADVYSLAATAYAALRGRPAFLEDTDETIAPMLTRVLTRPPDPLPANLAPAPVWSVLSTALIKDPVQRYASPVEFGQALQSAQRALDAPVTPMTVPGAPEERDDSTGTIEPVLGMATPESADLNATRTSGEIPPPAPGAGSAGAPSRRLRRAVVALVVLVLVGLATTAGVLVARVLNEDDPPPTTSVTAPIDPNEIDPADLDSPVAANPAARPTQLEVEPADGDLRITWVNNSPAARGVALQVGGRVQTVLLPDVTSYVVPDVGAEDRTCVLVGAVGSGPDAVSWASEPTCYAAAPPTAPTDLDAERGQGGNVELTWSITSGNEAGFEVLADGEVVDELPAGRTRAVLAEVVEDRRVCFAVVALNEAGPSSSSDEDCVPSR